MSLFDFRRLKGKVPFSRVLEIATDVLPILKCLHGLGFVHRDVKPHNIMLDINGKARLIDFGLAKRFLKEDGTHMPLASSKFVAGTYYFMSQNVVCGTTHSRRDDIESLLYSLLYVLEGRLPWPTMLELRSECSEDEASKEILKRRKELRNSRIARSFPQGLREIYKIVRKLTFDEEPPYETFLVLLEHAKLKGESKLLSAPKMLGGKKSIRKARSAETDILRSNRTDKSHELLDIISGDM